MSFVVLGGGRQGLACAYDLLRFTADDVTVADRDAVDLPAFLGSFKDRLHLRRLDVRDATALRKTLRAARGVCNATPYYFNLDVSRAAVAEGVSVCDLGGNTEIVLRQLELDAEARARGCSVLPDCGLAPGLVNILGARCIRELDVPRSVRIYTGGLPQDPRPPLNYQVVYSLDGVLDYYTSTALALEGGEVVEVEALSEVERVTFAGLGELEAFVTAGGISTMPYTYRGRLDRLVYKTLRYPGHAEKMRTLRELGLLSTEALAVDGARVRPRDVVKAALLPHLGEGRDVVAVRVEGRGELAGRPVCVRYDLLDRFDEATGITAMERTTGFGLAIAAQLQAAGRVAPGAATPDRAVDAEAYVSELGRRGIVVERAVQDEGAESGLRATGESPRAAPAAPPGA